MKSSEKTKSVAPCVLKGLALALSLELVLLLLLALLTSAGKIGEAKIDSLALLCGAVSCFAGALFCAKSVQKYVLPCAIGTGGAFVLANACVGALLSKYGPCGNPFVCVPLYLGASVLSAFLSAVPRRRPR